MSRSNRQPSEQNEPIADRNHKMPFGKYKNFTVGEVIEGDPQYIIWLHHNNNFFELNHILFDEAMGENSIGPNALFRT